MYVPQVGHATWLSFGCWHCGQVERAAAVVFHMLRRERVFERDIFRFGTGTVIVLNLKRPIGFNQPGSFDGRKYRLFLFIAQIAQIREACPTGIDDLMCVILGQGLPFFTTIRA